MDIPPDRIKLSDLMCDKKKLILEHGDKPYLLSITRKGRLILTAASEEKESVEPQPQP
jgi:hemin uptake protein HemP